MATAMGVSVREEASTAAHRPRSARAQETGNGARGLATALGWFSIGLGLAQIVAPRGVARLVGANPDEDTERLMRALGVREISSGIGILSNHRTDDWVRSRVAGDVMDLALLGRTMMSDDADRGKTIAATVAVLGVTALDILASERLRQAAAADSSQTEETMAKKKSGEVKHVRRAITIGKPIDEVQAFWRESGGDEAVDDETVRFIPAPGGRGTEVHLDRAYKSPGRIASVLQKFRFQDPDQIAYNELRALKQVLEVGEVIMSDAWQSQGPHAAQPDA